MSDKIFIDGDKISVFYNKYIKNHGIKSGWATIEDANNSYKEASSCSYQKWSEFESVLDFGSGEGHFIKFLREERDFQGTYIGIEVLDYLHNQAVELYGEMNNTNFIWGEFLNHDFGKDKFDWVVSLGSFSIKHPQQKECDLALSRKMISLANHGVSIFLSDVKYMRTGRAKEIPDLAFHDIDDFCSMLSDNFSISKIEVKHYPDEKSQPTMIHVIF